MIPVANQTKELKAALSGQNKFDSQNLSVFFAQVRTNEKKMEKLVRAFCFTYLLDKQQRPLRLRPLQMDIIVKSLTHPDGDPDKQRKLAILAIICGSSYFYVFQSIQGFSIRISTNRRPVRPDF